MAVSAQEDFEPESRNRSNKDRHYASSGSCLRGAYTKEAICRKQSRG